MVLLNFLNDSMMVSIFVGVGVGTKLRPLERMDWSGCGILVLVRLTMRLLFVWDWMACL